MDKTLIGKNDVLFLINDSGQELNIHCNNLNFVRDITLSRYKFNNYFMFVYPNKSLIYKDYLPDQYVCKYRPAFDIYKNKFNNNIFDLYEILKNETDVYYKTDTHINFKGNYIVYKYFIDILNSRLNLNLIPKKIDLNVKTCELRTLPYGIGDLTWDTNLGEQKLNNIQDTFYFSDECTWLYQIYIIKNDNDVRFLNYELNDITSSLEGTLCSWNTLSEYILYKKNDEKIPLKVIIFYDSFFLSAIPLYLDLFDEIYLIKSVYNNDLINAINPNFVFEFRVERFLF